MSSDKFEEVKPEDAYGTPGEEAARAKAKVAAEEAAKDERRITYGDKGQVIRDKRGSATRVSPTGEGGFVTDKLPGSTTGYEFPSLAAKASHLIAGADPFDWQNPEEAEQWKHNLTVRHITTHLNIINQYRRMFSHKGAAWDPADGVPVVEAGGTTTVNGLTQATNPGMGQGGAINAAGVVVDRAVRGEPDLDAYGSGLSHIRDPLPHSIQPAKQAAAPKFSYEQDVTDENGNVVGTQTKNKPRWVELFNGLRDYHHDKFMKARQGVLTHAAYLGAADMYDAHALRHPADEDGIHRCGNDACESSQAALKTMHEGELAQMGEATPSGGKMRGRIFRTSGEAVSMNYLFAKHKRDKLSAFASAHQDDEGFANHLETKGNQLLAAKGLRYDESQPREQQPEWSDWHEQPATLNTRMPISKCADGCGETLMGDHESCPNCKTAIHPAHRGVQNVTVMSPEAQDFMDDPKSLRIMTRINATKMVNEALQHPIWGKKLLEKFPRFGGGKDGFRGVTTRDLVRAHTAIEKDDPKLPDDADYIYHAGKLTADQHLRALVSAGSASHSALRTLPNDLDAIENDSDVQGAGGGALLRSPAEKEVSKDKARSSAAAKHTKWLRLLSTPLGFIQNARATSALKQSSSLKQTAAAKKGQVIDSSLLPTALPEEGRKRSTLGDVGDVHNMLLDAAHEVANNAGTVVQDGMSDEYVRQARALIPQTSTGVAAGAPKISGVAGSMPASRNRRLRKHVEPDLPAEPAAERRPDELTDVYELETKKRVRPGQQLETPDIITDTYDIATKKRGRPGQPRPDKITDTYDVGTRRRNRPGPPKTPPAAETGKEV